MYGIMSNQWPSESNLYDYQYPQFNMGYNTPHIQQRKNAMAYIKGGNLAPTINGMVYFINVPNGTNVCINVTGLPHYQPAKDGKAPIGPHGFHIHEHGNCEMRDTNDPFQAAGGHWNPDNQPHGILYFRVVFRYKKLFSSWLLNVKLSIINDQLLYINLIVTIKP